MNYSNKLLKEANGVFETRRKAAEETAERNREKLFENGEYLAAYNAYNGAKFDLGKAIYGGDEKAAKTAEESMKKYDGIMLSVMKNMGISKADITPKVNCEKCGDTGRTSSGKPCACFIKVLHELTLEDLGIEKRVLHDFSEAEYLDKNDLKDTYEKMKKYCSNIKNVDFSIVFRGEVGTGKSFLAECMANEVTKQGLNCVYLSAYDLYTVFLRYHNAPVYEKGDYLDLLLGCDFLVIDDLGCEPLLNNVSGQYLYTVISERAERKMPFLITTNLTAEQILEKYGERIMSRLNDKKRCITKRFSGEDLRKIK